MPVLATLREEGTSPDFSRPGRQTKDQYIT